MIEFLKDKIELYFSELLLSVMFCVVLGFVVHLIHKADAGGNDKEFIIWAEAADLTILNTLTGMILRNQKKEPNGTQAQPNV